MLAAFTPTVNHFAMIQPVSHFNAVPPNTQFTQFMQSSVNCAICFKPCVLPKINIGFDPLRNAELYVCSQACETQWKSLFSAVRNNSNTTSTLKQLNVPITIRKQKK